MDGTDFSEWLTNLAREAGYDPEPRRGGRASLARATGLNATHIGRLLDGTTKPDIDTMKKLVGPLNDGLVKRGSRRLTIIDMLLHTGDLEPGDVPEVEESVGPSDIDLWVVAQQLDVPEDQRLLFGRLVHSLAEQLSHGQKAASVSQHATQTGGKSSAEG